MATATITYICLAKKQQSSGDDGCRKSSDFGDGASTVSGDCNNEQYICEEATEATIIRRRCQLLKRQ